MTDCTMAKFGLGDDRLPLFRYLHALLREEGRGMKYQGLNSELNLIGEFDASEAPERTAERFDRSPIDEFRLELRDPAHHVSAALPQGLSLQSPSTEWLAAQRERWLAAGGDASKLEFYRRSRLGDSAFAGPDALPRLAAWLFETAGAGRTEIDWLDSREYPQVAQGDAKSADALLGALRDVASKGSLHGARLLGSRTEASANLGPGTSSLYVNGGDLKRLVEALDRGLKAFGPA